MQNQIRVLLIEHQTLTRIGIKTILSRHADIEIGGEAVSSAQGFELFKKRIPMS